MFQLTLATICALTALAPLSTVAQGPRGTGARSEPIVSVNPNGEATSAILDHLITSATESGDTVLVISRAGARESARYAERRLQNALARLIDQSTRLKQGQVVGALGTRTESDGAVEFYLAGELVFVARLRKNSDFSVDCCGDDGAYFPWFRGKSKYSIPR